MSNTLPTGPRGRLLALALTGTMLATLWIAVAAPLLAWHAERAETLAGRRELVARMERLLATLPRLQALAADATPTRALIAGDTDAIAGAALQSQLQEMAGGVGASLSSAEFLSAEQVGAYRRIALRVSLVGGWPVLVNLLRRIEEAAQGLLVDDLQVQAAPSLETGAGRPLSASFTVQGLRAGTAAQAGQAPP